MLPPAVQLAVRSRRSVLARRARGTVLDLGGAESHRSLFRTRRLEVVRSQGADDPLLDDLIASGQTFDTVFSVFALVATRDLDATLGRLRSLLDDGGSLLFLEPGPLAGIGARAQRLAAPAVRASTGWSIERDIPAELRAAGLSVTDIERHRTGTVQWWLRRIIEGAAHHALPLGSAGTDARTATGAAENAGNDPIGPWRQHRPGTDNTDGGHLPSGR